MSKITYTAEGTITDSEGNSMKFTNKDIVNLEIESGISKRIINNHSALKLQKLVKESTKEGNPPIIAGYLLQLIEESEK